MRSLTSAKNNDFPSRVRHCTPNSRDLDAGYAAFKKAIISALNAVYTQRPAYRRRPDFFIRLIGAKIVKIEMVFQKSTSG